MWTQPKFVQSRCCWQWCIVWHWGSNVGGKKIPQVTVQWFTTQTTCRLRCCVWRHKISKLHMKWFSATNKPVKCSGCVVENNNLSINYWTCSICRWLPRFFSTKHLKTFNCGIIKISHLGGELLETSHPLFIFFLYVPWPQLVKSRLETLVMWPGEIL